jgi:predicted Zn-dependent peptidase
MSSRLFQEVREKRGLAYAVYSFISAHVDTGMFGVYLAVSPGQALEAVGLVAEEIRKLTRRSVDPAELNGAVEYTKGNLLLASESADNQMVRIAQNEIHFQAEIPLETVIERIESVRPEDLLQLAGDLFPPAGMVLTLLGPVEADPVAFEDCLNSTA